MSWAVGWLPDGRSPVSPHPGTDHSSRPQPYSVLRCCLHGNATVFAPRPSDSQDSLSGEVGQLQPEAPNYPPLSHHRFPHRFPPGGPGGRAQPQASQCPWDWLLSRHWGCLSSSCFHHSAVSLGQGACTAHTLLAWGEPRVWGGQLRPLDSGHQHLVSSCGIALRCSPTVCFPHTVPVWGVAREVSLC